MAITRIRLAEQATPVPVKNEVPSGTLNGSNTVFTLANTPAPNSESVYLNGVRQKKDSNDYTISGDTITFTDAPQSTDILLVDYSTPEQDTSNQFTRYIIPNIDATQDLDQVLFTTLNNGKDFYVSDIFAIVTNFTGPETTIQVFTVGSNGSTYDNLTPNGGISLQATQVGQVQEYVTVDPFYATVIAPNTPVKIKTATGNVSDASVREIKLVVIGCYL